MQVSSEVPLHAVLGDGKLKRRNHTVPKFYLQRFADGDGKLMRVELPGVKRTRISVTNATVMKNFYVAEMADGTLDDAAEDAFGVLEEAAAKAIRCLVDDKAWPIPANMRMDIAGWAALQYLRAPWVRRLGHEIAEVFSGTGGVSVRTGRGDQIILKMPADVVEDLTGAHLQLDLIRRQLPVVTKMLYQRGWILTFYRRKSLATSDTPVVLRPSANHPNDLGIGLGNAGEIHLPLDRRVALSMGSENMPDARMQGVTKTALYLNDAMAKNARMYLFHHPEDDPIEGLELPHPRTAELADPSRTGELVEHLFH